jgi:hypothetical protein
MSYLHELDALEDFSSEHPHRTDTPEFRAEVIALGDGMQDSEPAGEDEEGQQTGRSRRRTFGAAAAQSGALPAGYVIARRDIGGRCLPRPRVPYSRLVNGRPARSLLSGI